MNLEKLSNELGRILPMHKCGLNISHNAHKDIYETVAETIERRELTAEDFLNDADMAQAVATDELWECQWYPDTPTGIFCVYSATLSGLLRQIEKAKNETGEA